jgi:hypothetical protein
MMEKLVIKKSVIINRELGYIVVLTIIISLELKKPAPWLFIPVTILLLLVFLLIKRLFDRTPKIVIDEVGIHDKRNKQVYPWESITDVEVNINSLGLLIKSKTSLVNINLTNLNTSPKEINEAIEFFSGNKIRTGKNKFREEIKRILKNDENIDEIIMLFSKYKTRILWTGSTIMFGIPALSIYLQFNSSFTFVFAIGYLLTGICIYAFTKTAELQFKKQKEVQSLTEQEYKELFIKFGLKNPENKKRELLGYIFLTVLSIGVFIISYLAGR